MHLYAIALCCAAVALCWAAPAAADGFKCHVEGRMPAVSGFDGALSAADGTTTTAAPASCNATYYCFKFTGKYKEGKEQTFKGCDDPMCGVVGDSCDSYKLGDDVDGTVCCCDSENCNSATTAAVSTMLLVAAGAMLYWRQ